MTIKSGLITALLFLSSTAIAADLDTLKTECDACHGPNGTSTHAEIPIIGGQASKFLAKTLRGYRMWDRPCVKSEYPSGPKAGQQTDMCKVAGALSDDDISALADWYAAQPFVPAKQEFDPALAAAGAEAQDWEGGTRIGSCLATFNRDWSRRVMGQGAVVLLITDGLDRDDPEALAAQMERLHLSARRLIWLNPLLRWDGFAPKARGIAAMLPHVDSFRAGHSIASLEELAEAISRPDDVGEKARLMRDISG